ncbi:hypothetical protein C8J57DRAFT_1649218 [Mycena rebaudengoi]|nr:hypothetical protein C8J57DRAFT_1649218 [Mycena rebaudengoi]
MDVVYDGRPIHRFPRVIRDPDRETKKRTQQHYFGHFGRRVTYLFDFLFRLAFRRIRLACVNPWPFANTPTGQGGQHAWTDICLSVRVASIPEVSIAHMPGVASSSFVGQRTVVVEMGHHRRAAPPPQDADQTSGRVRPPQAMGLLDVGEGTYSLVNTPSRPCPHITLPLEDQLSITKRSPRLRIIHPSTVASPASSAEMPCRFVYIAPRAPPANISPRRPRARLAAGVAAGKQTHGEDAAHYVDDEGAASARIPPSRAPSASCVACGPPPEVRKNKRGEDGELEEVQEEKVLRRHVEVLHASADTGNTYHEHEEKKNPQLHILIHLHVEEETNTKNLFLTTPRSTGSAMHVHAGTQILATLASPRRDLPSRLASDTWAQAQREEGSPALHPHPPPRRGGDEYQAPLAHHPHPRARSAISLYDWPQTEYEHKETALHRVVLAHIHLEEARNKQLLPTTIHPPTHPPTPFALCTSASRAAGKGLAAPSRP